MSEFRMPVSEPSKVIYALRDPGCLDLDHGWTLWISIEHHPHRVFQGHNGQWIFIGKFIPENI